jgi:hypothetical protein
LEALGWSDGDPLLLAASTHAGEEEAVAELQQEALRTMKQLDEDVDTDEEEEDEDEDEDDEEAEGGARGGSSRPARPSGPVRASPAPLAPGDRSSIRLLPMHSLISFDSQLDAFDAGSADRRTRVVVIERGAGQRFAEDHVHWERIRE